jgi:anti-anti-sigma factor
MNCWHWFSCMRHWEEAGSSKASGVRCRNTLARKSNDGITVREMEMAKNLAAMPHTTVRGQHLKSHESTTSSHLAIAVDRNGMEVIVRLKGLVDVDSSPDVRDCFLAILSRKQSVHAVTVDLSEVDHIESSGIATLVEALKIAGPRQIRVHLRGLQGSVLRLFEVTGLLPLFEKVHGLGKGWSDGKCS